MFSFLVKLSADIILQYFSYFSQKSGFDISFKLEAICMNFQIMFSRINKKNIINFVVYWISQESGNC